MSPPYSDIKSIHETEFNYSIHQVVDIQLSVYNNVTNKKLVDLGIDKPQPEVDNQNMNKPKTDDDEIGGEKVTENNELRGLIYSRYKSMKEMADRIGWSQQRLSKALSNPKKQSIENIKLILESLDVQDDPRWLVFFMQS